jgi:hypothetical protein
MTSLQKTEIKITMFYIIFALIKVFFGAKPSSRRRILGVLDDSVHQATRPGASALELLFGASGVSMCITETEKAFKEHVDVEFTISPSRLETTC